MMTPLPDSAPPALLRRCVAASLPFDDRASVLADLDTLFAARLHDGGRAAATAWYARQTAGFVLRVGSRRLADLVAGGGLRAEVRMALRSFRARPAFVSAFVLTLGMATGVLATVYAAARWVLLRPVPSVLAPEQLITLRIGSSEAPPFVSWNLSQPDLLVLRHRLPIGAALAGRSAIEVDLRAPGAAAERVAGELVTANYFTVLGARVVAGRAFLPEEEARAADGPVMVISHPLARRLAGDPAGAVGMSLFVNGVAVRVIGVAAAGFQGAELPGTATLWLPAAALGVADPTTSPGALLSGFTGVWRTLVGRLGDGVTVAEVEAATTAAVDAIRAEPAGHSFSANHQRLEVFAGIGLDPGVRASVRRTLTQLGVAAALLLVLAIANLTNLALIESVRRGAATAIRYALGATRGAIARSVLVEMGLLALASGAVGVGLSLLWSRWYQATRLVEGGGALAGMRVDLRVVLLACATAMAAALLVHLRPAFFVRRPLGDPLLRRGAGDAAGRHRLRSMLVSLQVALSVVLLVAAGLLGRTVLNLRSVDLGFAPNRLLTFSLDPHLHGYEARELDHLARELEAGLIGQPGVEGAGFISPAPLRSSYITAALYGSDDPEARPTIGAGFYVTPGLLPALGIRIVAGQDPWRGDSGTVVLSRTSLARLYPGVAPAEAIGRLVPTQPNHEGRVRIAAVIEDLHLSDITREAPPIFFRPLAERIAGLSLAGLVTGRAAPRTLAPVVHTVLAERAPDLPLFDLRTARAAIDQQFADRHAMARAALTLSAIGLLLAAIGLYGVLAAVIASRRREIGVRSALGAAPGRIVRQVLYHGLVPVAAGLVVGVGAALPVGRLLGSQLFGLAPLDRSTYAWAVTILAAAAFLAALVPAVRAARVSPVEVLREE